MDNSLIFNANAYFFQDEQRYRFYVENGSGTWAFVYNLLTENVNTKMAAIRMFFPARTRHEEQPV
jgi:hypothetical protein